MRTTFILSLINLYVIINRMREVKNDKNYN